MTGLDPKLSAVLMAALAFVLTIGGYDWIHFIQRWGTYLFLVVFGTFTVGVLLTGNPPAEQVSGDFAWTPFLVVIVIVASYQVSQAPYVSDYSRYLPRSSTTRSTFLWSYFGSAFGSFWMIALGAYLLASYADSDSIGAVAAGADAIFDGFSTIVLAVALIGLVSVISLNLYSGSLALLAAVDTVSADPGQRHDARRSRSRAIAVLGTAGCPRDPRGLPGQLQRIPRGPAVLARSVDRDQPRRLLLRPPRRLRDPRDLQAERDLWPVELAGPGLVRHRDRGHGALLQHLQRRPRRCSSARSPGRSTSPTCRCSLGFPFSALLYWVLCRNLDLTEERRLAAEEATELEQLGEAETAPAPVPAA